jgi:glycosyltransferase involved in cell wall biosynthesis
MKSSSPRYVLTTPVKNEREGLEALLGCVERLQPRPSLWVIVDDRSTDGSLEWLRLKCSSRPWIEVHEAPEVCDEYLGAHIARVKRWGLERALKRADELNLDVQFAGVLDADIHLPVDHYAALLRAFEGDETLGVVSSLIVTPNAAGEVVPEKLQRPDLPRGGTQFFRRRCLEGIGGLPPYPGFDGAANAKAQARGWRTQIVPGVLAVQRRETATRFGFAVGYQRKGQYAWFLGLHPLLVLARSIAYSAKTPHSAGWHFLKAWGCCAVRREPRCPDPEVRRAYGLRRVSRILRTLFAR